MHAKPAAFAAGFIALQAPIIISRRATSKRLFTTVSTVQAVVVRVPSHGIPL
jgi:hypothetical protein